MNDAPQESQPFVDVISIQPNIFLSNSGVQGEEALHASGLGENVGSMAELRRLDHNGRLQIEDLFTTKQINVAGAA